MKTLTYDKRVDKFWTYVDVVGGSDCWLWNKSLNSQGYGRFWDGQHEIMAHRFSYIVANGEFDRALLVCHRCDNPQCVRPSHLFLGTHLDNNSDRANKGRNRNQNGENHNLAKLTETQVLEIKNRLANGELGYKLAEEYGVQKMQISRIKNGKRWKHL